MKSVKTWISHNQGTFFALIVMAGITVYVFGCQSKVTSIMHPSRMVTGDELKLEVDVEAKRLEAELDQIYKQAELKYQDLARQDAIKQKLVDFALITQSSGAVNPAGIIGLLVGVLGVGATIDNRIKDKVIKNRPVPKVEA